jgi:hypothetical protein
MKCFIEMAPPTGSLDVQWVGMLGDGTFVVEAETEEEAQAKLLAVLAKTMKIVVRRPATVDEEGEFTEHQCANFTEQQWRDFEAKNEQST